MLNHGLEMSYHSTAQHLVIARHCCTDGQPWRGGPAVRKTGTVCGITAVSASRQLMHLCDTAHKGDRTGSLFAPTRRTSKKPSSPDSIESLLLLVGVLDSVLSLQILQMLTRS